jgi:hypothetical protein
MSGGGSALMALGILLAAIAQPSEPFYGRSFFVGIIANQT